MITLIDQTDNLYAQIAVLCMNLFKPTETLSENIIVDTDNANIRAFCSFKYEENKIYLQYFAVTENYRRKGIGKTFLRWIIDYFCGKVIYLYVNVNNNMAINLYKSVGFTLDTKYVDPEWYLYSIALLQ